MSRASHRRSGFRSGHCTRRRTSIASRRRSHGPSRWACPDGRAHRPRRDRHRSWPGLGRAVSERLAAMGASVVLASRNAPELDDVAKAIKRAGGKALAQTADIADERQVQELVLATERWVGPATILVNNAGMVDPIVPLARSNAALWLRSVAINVGGTYLATRAALPGMLDRGYGRIVTISSGAASRPSAGWTAYAAGKAAIVMMTRSLALELEDTGVTVCAFNPGYM